MYSAIKVFSDRLDTHARHIIGSVSAFFAGNCNLILIIFSCGLCAYGYELTHGDMTIDEEIHWDTSTNALAWQGRLGRWALYAYAKLLLPGLQFPFTSCLFSILFLSIAYALWLNSHKHSSFWSKAVFGCLAISFPTFGHMLSFSFMTAQVSFSCALTIAAYLLLFNQSTNGESFN